MYASNRRTSVLVGFGVTVQVSARLGSPHRAFGRREPALHQLALDSSAIGLAGLQPKFPQKKFPPFRAA